MYCCCSFVDLVVEGGGCLGCPGLVEKQQHCFGFGILPCPFLWKVYIDGEES